MKYSKSLLAALVAPLIALGSAATNVEAAGYAVFTHGASPLGQGNAVTAHTDDPSTMFYNPALMNKLDGTRLQAGTTAIISSREFDSNQPGGTSDDNTSVFFPSTFYATHKFNDSLSAGLGVFNPFGLGTEWDDTWDGRYLATESKLKSFNINPAISYRVIPSLAVAVGLDLLYVDATLERKLSSLQFGIPGPQFDIDQKFEGDGTGVGFNVGLAYDITDRIAFGAHYRSQVQVDLKGDSSTSLGAGPVDSDGRTSITLPPQFTAGIAYQVTDPLVIEAGIRWEGWSQFEELELKLNSGVTTTSPRDWHDSFGLNLGGKYDVNDNFALMLGYVFGNTAVPDSTFDPSIPDAKTHVFCVGSELGFDQFDVALSYAYQKYQKRTKENAIDAPVPTATSSANGDYRSDAHLVALSLGYKF